MPIPGARFRVMKTKHGKKVRLAFKDGDVVEAKNLRTGAVHTTSEFASDRKKRKKKRPRRGKIAGMLAHTFSKKFGHIR